MPKKGELSQPWPRLRRVLWRDVSELPLLIFAGTISIVILGLLITVFWTTFIEGVPRFTSEFSFANYADALNDRVTFKAGVNTVWVGLGTVILNLFFAVPMAWLVHRSDVPWKAFFLAMMYLTIMVPGFLKAMTWIMLLSPNIGIFNQFLNLVGMRPVNIYSLGGIIFLQGLVLTPLMFFMIAPAFLAMNPSLEEAAEVAGLHKVSVFRHISLPLLLPALSASVIYNFMTAVAMFEIPALLGLPNRLYVLSTLMYVTINTTMDLPRYGLAGVYGLFLMVPMLAALHFYQRLLKHSYRYAVVSGRGYRPKLLNLNSWKWAGLAFICFYFFLALFLPLLTLLWTSLTPYIVIPSKQALAQMTLGGYKQALSAVVQDGALVNTAILVGGVTFGVLWFSLAISWVVLRTRLPGRYMIDTMSMMPHAVPSIAFAFAISFLGVVVSPWIPVHGSLFSIVAAHIVAYVSFGTRNLNSVLIQIHRELDEAARTCGLSAMGSLRRIILPLLSPALFYGGLWVALLSYREVTMALFLHGPRNTVVTTTIWYFWANVNTSAAAALGLIMFITVAVGVAVLMRASSRFVHTSS